MRISSINDVKNETKLMASYLGQNNLQTAKLKICFHSIELKVGPLSVDVATKLNFNSQFWLELMYSTNTGIQYCYYKEGIKIIANALQTTPET